MEQSEKASAGASTSERTSKVIFTAVLPQRGTSNLEARRPLGKTFLKEKLGPEDIKFRIEFVKAKQCLATMKGFN